MESRVNYAAVGLFVIILTIALITAMFWLSIGFSKKSLVTGTSLRQDNLLFHPRAGSLVREKWTIPTYVDRLTHCLGHY